ncbi:MAG TPA: hypothetical protein EYO98_02150, partial [Candidatus Poseidoniales archaeon]|nr:hypothetical protein [Candidatus Poseidoniales archaeon]
MSAEDWSAKHRTLAAAGLLVLGDDAQEKLQTLPNLMPLIEAASASNTVMLTSRTIDELLAIVPTEATIKAEAPRVASLQATLARPESGQVIGRTLAPVGSSQPSPAPRPHGLEHFRLDDFPMLARDVDSEIEIHFDITGSSKTEGKMSDMKAFFSDRLEQIRRMMLAGRALPRRPISIVEAWRNRQRHTSREYEVTLVGLVS